MSKLKRRLYIAYGSNLNIEQMAKRCSTAKVVGKAIMRNWRLLFCGAATIERQKGAQVPVLVWDIQPKDEAALDAYEGWPRLYRKESVRVTLHGKQVRAFVYIMNSNREHPPSISYYNTILEGYIHARFDRNILRTAAQNSRKAIERGGISMNATVKSQILAVRDTGETNMFDINAVQRIAMREEYYELVSWLEDNRREYSRFILTGKSHDESEESE